jgi:chromosome segregation ATPase
MVGKSSKLDRCREKLQRARAGAEASSVVLTGLDSQLRLASSRASQLEAELAGARDRMAGLKKSIKATGKQREKLRTGRKQARQRAAEARQRATDAERRYDRVMLAEIVEREKRRDLSQHAGQGAASQALATVSSSSEAGVGAPPAASTAALPTGETANAPAPVTRGGRGSMRS